MLTTTLTNILIVHCRHFFLSLCDLRLTIIIKKRTHNMRCFNTSGRIFEANRTKWYGLKPISIDGHGRVRQNHLIFFFRRFFISCVCVLVVLVVFSMQVFFFKRRRILSVYTDISFDSFRIFAWKEKKTQPILIKL